MRLAAVKECRVPLEKLTGYLLNPLHADGSPKAAFFATCGYSLANAAVLADALAEHARVNDIAHEQVSRFGVKYLVECNLQTPSGSNPCIRTVWIDEGDAIARFVTAYPK